jgi:hypothetical protein
VAKATPEVIAVLRNTANKIQQSADYQWGHMGRCNCGFLVREITRLSGEEIHRRAMTGVGDWTEQLNDYCPDSGRPMDSLIAILLAADFDIGDLQHLEFLSDPSIRSSIGDRGQPVYHNVPSDVVRYLLAWASCLENELLEKIAIPQFVTWEAETVNNLLPVLPD